LGLRAGDVGTVVERHVVPDVTEEGYSVEFFDMTGKTVAAVTLPAVPFVHPRQPIVPPFAPSAPQSSGLLRRRV
jgi:hypothetical protein